MTRISLALVLACCTAPLDVPEDGAPPPVDAHASDAGTSDGAVVPDDASEPPRDAQTAPPGTCRPDLAPGTVSHSDCRSLRERPICDAISEQCVGLPDDYCGACRTDADCTAFDLHARCIFIPGDVPSNNDSACLVPCAGDSDCVFLRSAPSWSAVSCAALPGGSFCVPFNIDVPHCRNSSGARV